MREGKKNPFYGKKHTEETKKKISMANKGKKSWFKGKSMSNEQKKKLSETRKKLYVEGKLKVWNKGKPRSKATKEKISKVRKEQFRTGKSVISIEQRKQHSKRMEGKGNPKYGTKHSKETLQKISFALRGLMAGEKNPFYGMKHKESSKKLIGVHSSKRNFLEGNPMWQGGKSFEPYNKDFNRKIKEFVFVRDNSECQVCSKILKRGDIHHIDYDKLNSNPNNLILLCKSCHSKTTHGNRKRWQKFFQNKLNNLPYQN